MKFLITQASECPIDFGSANNELKNDSFVHLTCDSQNALDKLIDEFGAHSRNAAYGFKRFAPKTFSALNLGSGKYPVSTYVRPYLLDRDGKFTINRDGSVYGGIFIHQQDLDKVKNYITETFQDAEIIEDITRIQLRN